MTAPWVLYTLIAFVLYTKFVWSIAVDWKDFKRNWRSYGAREDEWSIEEIMRGEDLHRSRSKKQKKQDWSLN